MEKITLSSESKVVVCIFERDEDDWDKSNLIAIYDNPAAALKHLEDSKDEDLFYEQWQVHQKYKRFSI